MKRQTLIVTVLVAFLVVTTAHGVPINPDGFDDPVLLTFDANHGHVGGPEYPDPWLDRGVRVWGYESSYGDLFVSPSANNAVICEFPEPVQRVGADVLYATSTTTQLEIYDAAGQPLEHVDGVGECFLGLDAGSPSISSARFTDLPDAWYTFPVIDNLRFEVSAPPCDAGPFMLAVGNDGYVSDGYGLRDALTSTPNWQASGTQTRVLANRRGDQIASDDVAWLSGSAGANDLAVFYYSGHAGSDIFDFSWDEPASDYLDESIGLLTGDPGLSDDDLAAALRTIDPDTALVVILDTCHAGGFVDGLDDLCTLPNAYILLSCTADESSYGGDEFSEFTEALITAITDSDGGYPADGDGDGRVTLDEWYTCALINTSGQTPQYLDTGNLGAYAVVTPEPATLLLLVAGGLGLLSGRARRRCRRRRHEPYPSSDA